jgi:hypothetical protein
MRPTYLRPVHKVSAPVLFLVGLLVVGAVGGATFAVASALGVGDEDSVGSSDSPAITLPGETPPDDDAALLPDQVRVTGFATGITVEGATLPRIDTPLTVTVPDTGVAGAGATITDVEVDGEITDIHWDAGRPFDLRATGLGIKPPDVNLFAAPTAITIGFLDGIVNELEPGTYGLQTPVAIGSAGLGRPQEAVAFEASVESTVSFRGGATTAILPRFLELQSEGRVLIQGQLTVEQPSGETVTLDQIELPAGEFAVKFTPRGDGTGYDVDALLRGEVLT